MVDCRERFSCLWWKQEPRYIRDLILDEVKEEDEECQEDKESKQYWR